MTNKDILNRHCHSEFISESTCYYIYHNLQTAKMNKNYYVYITTNISNAVLYIGVTNNLPRRIYEHKNGLVEGFSKKYKTNKLVYYETNNDINAAIAREKQLKNWHREWKINLIEAENPGFAELNISEM